MSRHTHKFQYNKNARPASSEDTQPIQRIGTLLDFVAGLLAGKKNVCAAATQAVTEEF